MFSLFQAACATTPGCFTWNKIREEGSFANLFGPNSNSEHAQNVAFHVKRAGTSQDLGWTTPGVCGAQAQPLGSTTHLTRSPVGKEAVKPRCVSNQSRQLWQLGQLAAGLYGHRNCPVDVHRRLVGLGRKH